MIRRPPRSTRSEFYSPTIEADSDKTVEQYETFVNDVLRTKLKNCLDRREEVCNDIREYSELRNTIFNLRDLDSKPLKTQVDLGCNFFVQAEVSDLSKIFTAVGFGFFLELTPEESLNFIDKKIAFLNKSVEHLNEQAAAIKADIRMILDILGELQKIKLPYSQLFGGAVALLSKQFRRINGYSNEFFGWGGEDDDFYNRLRRSGLPLVRFEQDISRYIMIDHAKESPNPDRFEMLRHGRWRYDNDGLNDLHYAVDDFELRPLYTWILVEL
nr:EOG090X0MWD [Cyclestheria hislopi]